MIHFHTQIKIATSSNSGKNDEKLSEVVEDMSEGEAGGQGDDPGDGGLGGQLKSDPQSSSLKKIELQDIKLTEKSFKFK